MRSSFFGRKSITGLIAGAIVMVVANQTMAEGTFVTQGSKAEKLDACVAPTADIRRNHMDYLKHGRDEVVIAGDRSGKYQLNECIDCHATTDDSGSNVPVNADGQFCASCHEYVAVSLSCFQCHRTTPEPTASKLGQIDLGSSIDKTLHASMLFDPTLHRTVAGQRD